MRDKRAARENMDRALREQAETEALLKKADDTVKKKEREADKSYSEAYNNSNIVRRERTLKEFNSFKQNVKSTLLENLFTGLFNDSLGNTKLTLSEDTKVFNRSLIMSFIKEEGVDDILKRMSTTSRFTSEMANIIKEKSDEIIGNVFKIIFLAVNGTFHDAQCHCSVICPIACRSIEISAWYHISNFRK